MKLSRSSRAVYASGVALAALLATEARAQNASAAPGADDATIVVTARRRVENLIDVPIAVSAISGTDLQRSGAIDITDISNSVPNVTLETSRGTNSTLTAFIRGVGQQDPVAGFEAGVGLYLDDVYLNRPQAAVLDIYDVERIEVLRGPQGTLYGRNTIGGAVKYVTRRLGDRPSLSARATYGSYNQADGVITASLPIGDGTVRLGGSLARLTRDGFGRNTTTGLSNYNKNIWAGRLSAEIVTTDAFFRLSGDYTKDKSNPRGGHRLIPGLFTGAPVLASVYDTRGALNSPVQDVESYGVSLFAELDPTENLRFRSISAYRKDDSASPIDFDALPAVDVDVPAFYNNEQFSQELQALVDVGPVNALFGAYYLYAKARTVFDVRLPNAVTALTFGDVKTDTYALFADVTAELGAGFSISAGGRYTWDTRSSTILRQTFLGGGSPFFGGTGTVFATTSDFRGRAEFKKFTPRAALSFKPNADHTLYASYSQGFKGGGFDPRGVSTAAPDSNADGVRSYQEIYNFLSFRPESVNSYELGYKASLFDRRLNIALAAFHADYTDVQIPGSIGAVVGGQQTFIGITTNAGKAKIDGVEFEGRFLERDAFAVGNTLSFNWSIGYINARYTRFIDSRGLEVSRNRAFQNTPEWTASATLGYGFAIGNGMLNANTSLSYRSRTQQFELANEFLDQPAYALLDAGLTYTAENDRWTVGVYGRNLTDKRYLVSGYTFLGQNADTAALLRGTTGAFVPTLGREGVLTAYYGNPRQIFATVGVKF
jgi:iron complex outermembrane recepter protein